MTYDDMIADTDRFFSDVKHHSMKVRLDIDGPFRHLRFDNDGSSIYHFNLTTWPGYLAITGDMGAYTFSRLQDMFEFFRRPIEGKKIPINPDYWAEKLVAVAKNSPPKRFSTEVVGRVLRDIVDERFPDEDQTDHKKQVWEQIEDDVLHLDNEHDVIEAVRNLEGIQIDDFYEHDLTEWSHDYLWACRAIVWGIAQYDASKLTKQS